MKEKIQILTILSIILGVIILCLASYIVYDKVFNKEITPVESKQEEKVDEKTEEQNTKKDEEEIEVEKFTEEELDQQMKLVERLLRVYPSKNDAKVTGDNLYKKFKSQYSKYTFYYGNYKIVYNYVDGGTDESNLTIYNKKNNKKLYYNGNVKIELLFNDYIYNTRFLPTISGGKLHFLFYNTNNCYVNPAYVTDRENGKMPYLEYIQIDLTGKTINAKTILSIKDDGQGLVLECKY
jgi:hypothetical protein